MTDHQNEPVRSITDLARIAGVSVSTVSRALTSKGALNKDTRRRIQELAARHGFQLNVAAQNLRLGRTGAIAVLLPLGHERGQHLSDPFFMAMLGFLADELTERGYDLLLSRVLPDGEDWLDAFIRAGRVDGVIIIGQSDQSAVLDRTASHYRPLVIWGAHAERNQYLTIGTDNVAGGALAARHLLERGRGKLAFFSAMSQCRNLPPAMKAFCPPCPPMCAIGSNWFMRMSRRRPAIAWRPTILLRAIASMAYLPHPT